MNRDCPDAKRFFTSFISALLLEGGILAAAAALQSGHSSILNGYPNHSLASTGFIVTLENRKHTPEPARAAPTKLSHTLTVAKAPGQSQTQPPCADCTRNPARLESSDHGPLPYYHPAPRLPDSLTQDKIQMSVLIEFSVSSDANTTSQLVSSSGNKRLDALAMDTAREWKFYPAEADGRPIDSRVRLKINFQVL